MSATAYYDGYWTALDGTPRDANPYRSEEEPEFWHSWDEGWEDAQETTRVSDR